MRMVAAAVALMLFAPMVRAEEATERGRGKVGLRVVRVMPESHQALLFDRARAKHMLAEVGHEVAGYIVASIDDDEVRLTADGKEIILVAPGAGGDGGREAAAGRSTGRSTAGAGSGAEVADGALPVDPYADSSIRAADASTPSGDSRAIEPTGGGVRATEAPGLVTGEAAGSPAVIRSATATTASTASDPAATTAASEPAATTAASDPAAASNPAAASDPAGEQTVSRASTTVAASGRPRPPPLTPARPIAVASRESPEGRRASAARELADVMTASGPPRGLAPTATPGSMGDSSGSRTGSAAGGEVRGAAASTPGVATLARAEVNHALDDFAGLSAAMRGRFSAAGVVLDEVAAGSIFWRAGLRSGDVVVSVEGLPLRSLDDAANVYARVSTARAITAQVVRAGASHAIHLVIQ
jgi:hypothetical protein